MRTLFYSLFFLLISTSCRENLDCTVDQSMVHSNDSTIAALLESRRFNAYWDRIPEPQLSKSNAETYRFIFHHERYSDIYTLVNEGDSYQLTLKEYQRLGEREKKDSLLSAVIATISEDDCMMFNAALDEMKYWSTPVIDDRRVLDGSGWALEGFMPDANNCTERTYHIVVRISPEPSPFRDVCELLMDLGNQITTR